MPNPLTIQCACVCVCVCVCVCACECVCACMCACMHACVSELKSLKLTHIHKTYTPTTHTHTHKSKHNLSEKKEGGAFLNWADYVKHVAKHCLTCLTTTDRSCSSRPSKVTVKLMMLTWMKIPGRKWGLAMPVAMYSLQTQSTTTCHQHFTTCHQRFTWCSLSGHEPAKFNL